MFFHRKFSALRLNTWSGLTGSPVQSGLRDFGDLNRTLLEVSLLREWVGRIED
ncbi:Uncharacterised protein [Vibrio cholerae]|nr:Uncharacterised protein [Vibrio cholerae]